MEPVFDPHACPFCRASDDPFQELADRFTWQPLTLTVADDGHLTTDDYHSFDYGDDVRVTGYQCSSCSHTWETLAALERDQRIVGAFTAAMEGLEQSDCPPDLEPLYAARHEVWEAALEIFRGDGIAPERELLGPRTAGQNRAYHRMIRAVADLRDDIELSSVKEEALGYASALTGREVTSSKDLTEGEMRKVLDWLDGLIKAALRVLA